MIAARTSDDGDARPTIPCPLKTCGAPGVFGALKKLLYRPGSDSYTARAFIQEELRSLRFDDHSG